MMTTIQPKTPRQTTAHGFTLIELVVALSIAAVFTAIALPQLTASRRLSRLAAIPKQVSTQLRLARQQAMSQRRAVTFQYDKLTQKIVTIVHPNAGTAVLTASNYPNTSGSTQLSAVEMAGGGVSTSEISYGIPSGLPTTALGDGSILTPLANNKVNITFQPDGSVINAAGLPINVSLFFYNSLSPKETASAVSVLGSSGRVKIWRYSTSANLYAE